MTANCKEMHRFVKRACVIAGIVDQNQIDYILATAEWETAHTCRPVREAFWLSEGWRERHLRYHPYYGRGFVQITWKHNYEKFSELLGIDLVNNPDLALEPSVATDILVLGFRDGLFTGHKISDFINEDYTDFVGARKCINGHDKDVIIASMARAEEYLV